MHSPSYEARQARKQNLAQNLVIRRQWILEVDLISWDKYIEVNDLIELAKQYKQERGYHPARICADAIYMTVEIKKFCREHGIRPTQRSLTQEGG
jgi:hypothetical protein